MFKRNTFLMVASAIAMSAGIFALFFPASLLKVKGAIAVGSTLVWASEVGLVLISMGLVAFLVREHRSSPTLRAFFVGNVICQVGLGFIEMRAFYDGVITKLSGLIPNLVIHGLLASAFVYHLWMMRKSEQP